MDKLYATHTGTVTIGNAAVRCAVLNNGKRVFIQREIVGLLTGNKKGGLDRYLKPKNLQKYLPEQFMEKGLAQSVYKFDTDNQQAQALQNGSNH